MDEATNHNTIISDGVMNTISQTCVEMRFQQLLVILH